MTMTMLHVESTIDSVITTSTATTTSTTPTTTKTAETTTTTTTHPDAIPEPTGPRGLKVLFLSSDTGGGHRASAESLARQFELLYPGTTYALLDVVEKDGVPPYNSLVSWYQQLSARPAQWKLVYSVSNSRAFEMLADAHLKLMCERAVRRRIKGYNPDVVISVHPLMCNVPVLSCKKISKETGKHLPMFTVVTDLGSAHCLWFANGVEKMFVGSDQVWNLAKQRGKVPDSKLYKLGLPIRHQFAELSEKLGDRLSPEGKAYQNEIKKELGLPFTNNNDVKTILVMGGGEGVGSLSNIVDALYCELVSQGIDAQILVVCGRNEKLKNDLDQRDWNTVINRWVRAKDRQLNRSSRYSSIRSCMGASASGLTTTTGCIEGGSVVRSSIRRILSTGSFGVGSVPLPDAVVGVCTRDSTEAEEEKKCSDGEQQLDSTTSNNLDKSNKEDDNVGLSLSPTNESASSIVANSSLHVDEISDRNHFTGQVTVIGLGFVTKMAEYMVAADVLVTKAGPGTISEAAALSLPVMVTSYLPGQEEGNVDFVVDNKFGAFCSDRDPNHMAEELCMWLTDNDKMRELSLAAKAAGSPYAARDIVQMIGDSTWKWKETNEHDTITEDVSEEDEDSQEE